MNSIAFPNMFNSSRTLLYNDREATLSNLKLLLQSFKGTLLGDPYYGSNINQIIYSNNYQILYDLVVDDIYTCIAEFMPQLRVDRKDIVLKSDGTNLSVQINATNLLNYTSNLYEINLTGTEE